MFKDMGVPTRLVEASASNGEPAMANRSHLFYESELA